MQHCQQPVFGQESFCGYCGEQVESSHLAVKGIESLNPEIMENLRTVYPDAKIISGKVKSTYYYKRTFKSSNNNLTYGYWWIELEDEQGNTECTSIEAEDEFFNSIKKGDVLTLLSPVGYQLNYKIADSNARKIVKNNSMPLCVINHLPTEQRSIRDSALDPPSWKTSWIWTLVWIVVALGLNYGLDLREPLIGAGAGAIAALACYLWERRRNKARYEQGQHRFEVLKKTIKALLRVSRNDLGYHLQSRPTLDTDINCSGCHSRIPGSHSFCVKCGLDINTEQGSVQSIAELESALMSEYSLSYTEDYLHKNLLSASPKGQVEIQGFMAKVLSKDVESDVSDVSVTTTQTTRTDHYYGNRFSHSSYDTKSSTHRTRQSGITGNVWLLREDGEKVKWEFSEQVLGDLDIGDWLFFSYSDVNIGNRNDYNRECAINITKDRTYSTSSFQGIGGLGNQLLWWLLAGVFAMWFFTEYREPQYALRDMMKNTSAAPIFDDRVIINYTPLILFGLLNIYFLIHGSVCSSRNKKRQVEILKPMRETIAKLRANLTAIQEQVKIWG